MPIIVLQPLFLVSIPIVRIYRTMYVICTTLSLRSHDVDVVCTTDLG
jgi:hypothetical protein